MKLKAIDKIKEIKVKYGDSEIIARFRGMNASDYIATQTRKFDDPLEMSNFLLDRLFIEFSEDVILEFEEEGKKEERKTEVFSDILKTNIPEIISLWTNASVWASEEVKSIINLKKK